ncbi:hypothetical protein [Nafulsella turpanensis]|uniref:hypothetical protein n=1 Tax=Nafulsella turpanensis TaxID=1265690 RepID=UPI00037EF80F|nr:hypothetical protein [Nafulsella turpanensis]
MLYLLKYSAIVEHSIFKGPADKSTDRSQGEIIYSCSKPNQHFGALPTELVNISGRIQPSP